MKKRKLQVILALAIVVLIFYFSLKSWQSDNSYENEEFIKLIRTVNYLSEWDSTEDYRITSPLIRGNSLNQLLSNDVTLITQCSFSSIKYLHNLTTSWQGPVSVAVFAENMEVTETLSYIVQLRHCVRSVYDNVTFHLVTYRGSGNIKDSKTLRTDCTFLDRMQRNGAKLQNYGLSVAYPVNLMRNVARRGISTTEIFLIDIDMMPSPGLRRGFLHFAKASHINNNTLYVVPAFEINAKIRLPSSKIDVKKLIETGLMRPFYAELCPKCQNCIDHTKWLEGPSNSANVQPVYSIQWKDPCEPFYIASNRVPQYDESFKQYGFNRISQVCEAHVAGFEFVVLDNAFLTHSGLKTRNSFHEQKEFEQEENRLLFRAFKQRLKIKYPQSMRRCY